MNLFYKESKSKKKKRKRLCFFVCFFLVSFFFGGGGGEGGERSGEGGRVKSFFCFVFLKNDPYLKQEGQEALNRSPEYTGQKSNKF